MTLILTPDEIRELTNGLSQPAAQLRELHRLGFTRAHRPRGGAVVLSRAHYLAVEEGRAVDKAQNGPEAPGPNVVGLQQWAQRRQQRGQKTQGR